MEDTNRKSHLLSLMRTEHSRLEALLDSFQQVLQVVENLSEEDLASEELYTHLANNTGNHYAEHRQMIEAGLSE